MSTEQWKLKDAVKLEHKEDDDNHCSVHQPCCVSFIKRQVFHNVINFGQATGVSS